MQRKEVAEYQQHLELLLNNEMVDGMPDDLHFFTNVGTVDDLDDATMFP